MFYGIRQIAKLHNNHCQNAHIYHVMDCILFLINPFSLKHIGRQNKVVIYSTKIAMSARRHLDLKCSQMSVYLSVLFPIKFHILHAFELNTLVVYCHVCCYMYHVLGPKERLVLPFGSPS